MCHDLSLMGSEQFLNPADDYKTGPGTWGVGGRAEKQGFALLMLEDGDALAMLQWIVCLADAFKVRLYLFTSGYKELNVSLMTALRTTSPVLVRPEGPILAVLRPPGRTAP